MKPNGGLLLALSFLALLSAGEAGAAIIPSAEKGAVILTADRPGGLDHPSMVATGQIAWTETYHPALAVRLLSPAYKRIRPNLRQLPIGTVLFGYQLPSGLAYCPPIDFKAAVPDTQCLRDFDDNGTFDGGYFVEWNGNRSTVMAEVLQGLIAVPPVHYEAIDPKTAMSVPGSVTFEGFSRGAAMFRVRVDKQRLDSLSPCVSLPDGDCAVLGLTLHVEANSGGAAITLVAVEPIRGLSVVTTGGPNISGFRHFVQESGQ